MTDKKKTKTAAQNRRHKRIIIIRLRQMNSLTSFMANFSARGALFCFFMLAVIMAISLVGNFQHFLDSSQILLLKMITVFSIFLILFSILSLVLIILEALVVKHLAVKKVFHFIFFVITLAMSIAGLIVSRTMLILAYGIVFK